MTTVVAMVMMSPVRNLILFRYFACARAKERGVSKKY